MFRFEKFLRDLVAADVITKYGCWSLRDLAVFGKVRVQMRLAAPVQEEEEKKLLFYDLSLCLLSVAMVAGGGLPKIRVLRKVRKKKRKRSRVVEEILGYFMYVELREDLMYSFLDLWRHQFLLAFLRRPRGVVEVFFEQQVVQSKCVFRVSGFFEEDTVSFENVGAGLPLYVVVYCEGICKLSFEEVFELLTCMGVDLNLLDWS